MQDLLQLRGLLIPAILGVALAPTWVRGDILGFGDFSNFARNQSDANQGPSLFPGPGITSKIEITNDSTNEGRSIFYNTPQSVSHFTASFTYQAVDGHADSADSVGVAFVIQDSPSGASAIAPFGGSGPLLGYGGVSPSIALTLQLGAPTVSGLFFDGNVGGGAPSTAPVNLLSGDLIGVTLVYNGGTTLSETITDGNLPYSSLLSLPATLQSILGSPTAFVGFTAGAYDVNFDRQYISNFAYRTPEPSSFVLAGIGAAALIAFARRRRNPASRR